MSKIITKRSDNKYNERLVTTIGFTNPMVLPDIKLYFKSEMQKISLNFIEEIASIVKPINQLGNDNEKKDIIVQCYNTMTNSSSSIRNNISLANIKLENIIKEIRKN